MTFGMLVRDPGLPHSAQLTLPTAPQLIVNDQKSVSGFSQSSAILGAPENVDFVILRGLDSVGLLYVGDEIAFWTNLNRQGGI